MGMYAMAGRGGGATAAAPAPAPAPITTSVLDMDCAVPGAADWSSDDKTARTIDGVSVESSAAGASVWGPDGVSGIAAELVNASVGPSGRLPWTQLLVDLAPLVASNRWVVFTAKCTGVNLAESGDYLILAVHAAADGDGPGGDLWVQGSGDITVAARNTSGGAPTTDVAATGQPSTYSALWLRAVLDTVSGLVRFYYSTTEPSSDQHSGGMTLAGVAVAAASRAAAATPPDPWSGALWGHVGLYRSVTAGTTLAAVIEAETAGESEP